MRLKPEMEIPVAPLLQAYISGLQSLGEEVFGSDFIRRSLKPMWFLPGIFRMGVEAVALQPGNEGIERKLVAGRC